MQGVLDRGGLPNFSGGYFGRFFWGVKSIFWLLGYLHHTPFNETSWVKNFLGRTQDFTPTEKPPKTNGNSINSYLKGGNSQWEDAKLLPLLE